MRKWKKQFTALIVSNYLYKIEILGAETSIHLIILSIASQAFVGVLEHSLVANNCIIVFLCMQTKSN